MLNFLNKNNFCIALFCLMFFAYLREQLIIDAMRRFTEEKTSLSQICVLGMILLISLYAIYKKHERLESASVPKHFVKLVSYTYLISVFWSFIMPLGSISTYGLLILPALISWFAYSIIYEEDNETFFLICLSVGLLVLANAFFETLDMSLLLGARDDSTVNGSYYLLYLTPLFLCSKNKYLRIISVVFIFFIVITSAKRGGTIAMTLATVVYLFINSVLIEKKGKQFRNIIVFLIVAFVAGCFLVNYLETSDIVVVRRLIETTENSGDEARSAIWLKVIEMISTSNIFQLIFGHGYNSVLADNPLGFSAHNDFLEILYDFGVIAFVGYVALYHRIYKFCKELVERRSRYAGAMFFSVCLLIINSMVSHIFIYPFYASTFALVWGTIYAMFKKEQKTIIKAL